MCSLINHHSFCFLFFRLFFYAVAFMLTGSIFFLQILHKTIADPPRKRVDTRPSKSYRTEMLANGSPIAPRRFPYGYVVVYMLIIIAFISIFFHSKILTHRYLSSLSTFYHIRFIFFLF